jgi:hypothetical protein
MRSSWCILILLCLTPTIGAEEPSVPVKAPSDKAAAESAASDSAISDSAISDKEIARWVDELDGAQFDNRERAQKTLIEAGDKALSAVVDEARHGSLESSTRAINILLAWAESDESELVIAALENLVGLEDHPKQAKAAEERLFYVREYLALKKFEELGGEYQVDLKMARNILPAHRLEYLQVIIGAEWKGNIEGLKLLEDMPHVTTVSFHSSPLGDDALKVLTKLPQIRFVDLYGTKRMTQDAIASIKEQLPNATFDERGPAFLGVQNGSGDHAAVGHVVSGSPADIAGIKPDDTIMKFEGKEIKDFRELTTLIAEHEAGDTVTLTIIRQTPNGLPEMIDLKVTFAQWGKDGAGKLDNIEELNRALPGRGHEPTKAQMDRR